MKKIITLLVLLSFFKGNTQCPAPSNLTLSIPNATSAQLSWAESGTANNWEIAIIPDFTVGTPLPSEVLYATTSNPFIIIGLSPAMGCNVFFVRSRCSTTDVSPWIAVGTLGCSTNVYNYLTILSNNSFLSIYENSSFKVFPNPANKTVTITSNNKNIKAVTLCDLQGRILKNIDVNTINTPFDISNYQSVTYLLIIKTDFEVSKSKLIIE